MLKAGTTFHHSSHEAQHHFTLYTMTNSKVSLWRGSWKWILFFYLNIMSTFFLNEMIFHHHGTVMLNGENSNRSWRFSVLSVHLTFTKKNSIIFISLLIEDWKLKMTDDEDNKFCAEWKSPNEWKVLIRDSCISFNLNSRFHFMMMSIKMIFYRMLCWFSLYVWTSLYPASRYTSNFVFVIVHGTRQIQHRHERRAHSLTYSLLLPSNYFPKTSHSIFGTCWDFIIHSSLRRAA